MPSLKSSVAKLRSISASATAVASASVWNCASHSWRFMTAIDRGETSSASSVAYASTASRSLPPGTTRLTSPIRSASAASIFRPESIRSSACASPTSRGSIQLMPCSAMSPRRENAVVNTAPSAATRMSQ